MNATDLALTIALAGGGDNTEKITQAVTDWLDENVVQETGYVIDKTLLVEDAAADAKTVGDKIADVKSAISDLSDYVTATFPQETVTDTAIASFTDGADNIPIKSLKIDIDPVQNLHGYSTPWVGGAGKNKVPSILNGGVSSITHGDVKLTVVNGMFNFKGTSSASGGRNTLRTADFVLPAGTYYLKQTLVSTANWPSVFVMKSSDNSSLVTDTGSFTLAEETTVYVGWNIVNTYVYDSTAKVQVESGSEATNWMPYANECPISGYTSVHPTRTGKNLLAINPFDYEINGMTFTANSDGSFVVNGLATADWGYSSNNGAKAIRKLLKNHKYTLSGGHWANTGVAYIQLVYDGDEDGATISLVSTSGSYTYTATQDATLRSIFVFFRGGNNFDHDLVKPMFEEGASASAFESPDFSAISILFPDAAGTVCCGNITLNEDGSADLAVTHGIDDLGNLTWVDNSDYGFYSNAWVSSVGARSFAGSETPNALCSALKVSPSFSVSGATADNLIGYASGSLMARSTQFANATAFKAAMNGQKIVFELALPVAYHIDKEDAGVLTTLLGLNYVFAETGNVNTLTYRGDPSMYQTTQINAALSALAAMIANVETSMTASKAYSVNDFLTVNGKLYIVTADIAQGGTITPNTNVTATTVGEQLAEILNS